MSHFGDRFALIGFLSVGPVAGLIVAGLTGPLTWHRGLPAAVLGAVLVMTLRLARSGMMIGMPRSAWEAAGRPSLRATPADYAAVLVGTAAAGLVLGTVLLGLWRIIVRRG